MNFIEELKIRAKERKMTIILPEVMDERIFKEEKMGQNLSSLYECI